MKETNLWIALLLSICLVFCLAACGAEGKDTPVRQSEQPQRAYTEEMYEKFGVPTLANYIQGKKLVADITIESWLRDDDYDGYKGPRDLQTLYTYYKARVNKVYAGDQSLEGKTIQYAQNGVEEQTVYNDSLPGKGDRMLAILTDSSNADSHTYTAVGYNKGVFFILEYQDEVYAIKKYGRFEDLSDLECSIDQLHKLLIYMGEETDYQAELGMITGADDQCFPQAFVLKDLEARIEEDLRDS